MHPRAAQLIITLGLEPHPEGGHFREVHRSEHLVVPDDGRRSRNAMTVIYFLLTGGEVSRWHRVASDETWHFHEGDVLELWISDSPGTTAIHAVRLGALADGVEPVGVVSAGRWQAAQSTGAYTLVSCSVSPGFEFEDFEMA
jgi:predicted cupin superfamily sugar epimerase